MAKRKMVGLIMIWLAVVLVLNGCEPLRKKFIRQKKKDQDGTNAFIPILEPVDYQEKTYTAAELYKRHYSLYQGLVQDFIAAMEERNENKKKELYNLDQAIGQLQAMEKLLVPEKQTQLQSLVTRFEAIREDVDSPSGFAKRLTIKTDAESLGREFRENYKFPKVQNSFTTVTVAEDQPQ